MSEPTDKLFSRKLPNEEKWAKSQDLFNVKLPRRIWSKKGTRLMFVVDRVPNEDIREGVLLSNKYGIVLNNLVDDIQERNNYPIAEFAAINLHCFRINKLNQKLRAKALNDFYKRVMVFAQKYQPDCIVFLGNESSRLAFGSSYEPSLDQGRVTQISYKDSTFNCIGSLSLDIVATTNGEQYGNWPNLLGFSYRHIEQAVNKDNFYHIQSKVDNTKKIYIDSLDKFNKFFSKLKKADIVGIDTENVGLNRINNRMLSMQFCLDGKKGYFLPIYHPETPFDTKEIEYIKSKLKYYFEFGKSRFHIWQNAKYDVTQVRVQLDVRFYKHNLYDTMAGEYNLDENRKFLSDAGVLKPYRLDSIEAQYGYRRPDLKISKDDRGNLETQSISDVYEYATIDAISIYWIAQCQINEAERRGIDRKTFINTVTELNSSQIHGFADMETNGTVIDKSYLLKMRGKNSEFNRAIEKVNEDLKNSKYAKKANKKLLKQKGAFIAGQKKSLFSNDHTEWVFKINKPYHKHVLFHDVMQLEGDLTKEGNISTNDAFKKKHIDKYKEVQALDNYDKNTKLKTTFVDGIHKKLSKDEDAEIDGKLRPNYKFIDIITGRAGCENPNFQQIPSRGELAKLIKRMFIAPPNYILVEVDYSAHEVRMWGNISGDDKLCGAFAGGYHLRRKLRLAARKKRQQIKEKLLTEGDIHRINFKFFFGRFPKDKGERQGVKSVVFGTVYGMGARSLASSISNSDKIAGLKTEITDIKKELKKRKQAA